MANFTKTVIFGGSLVVGASALIYWGSQEGYRLWQSNTECSASIAVLDRETLPPIELSPRTPPDGYQLYRNEQYRFSVFHKKERVVTEYREANGGMTVTFQNPVTLNGFQIFIVPYNEDHITDSRFRADIRTWVIEGTTTVSLDGICATSFLSKSVAIGETREVWAIHNGFLYEITTFRDLDETVETILSSWRFL